MQWFLRGGAAVCVLVAAGAGWYEWRGRGLRRQDAALDPPCMEGERISLRDGRRLGYRETGVRDGAPVLYFHGALGSRLEWPASPTAAAEAKVRLIAIDRAGYGCSDPLPRHTLAQSVDDVRQLADALGMARFRVVAWSAGTVYAMACAVRMPERIVRLDLVGAAVPEKYPEGRADRDRSLAFFAGLAQWAPGTAYALMRRIIVRREAEPEWFEQELEKSLSATDRAFTRSASFRPLQKRSHAAGGSAPRRRYHRRPRSRRRRLGLHAGGGEGPGDDVAGLGRYAHARVAQPAPAAGVAGRAGAAFRGRGAFFAVRARGRTTGGEVETRRQAVEARFHVRREPATSRPGHRDVR